MTLPSGEREREKERERERERNISKKYVSKGIVQAATVWMQSKAKVEGGHEGEGVALH